MKIRYEFLTGEIIEIEVSDSMSEIFMSIDQSINNSDRRETRRHNSLEALLEQGRQIAAAQCGVSAGIELEETLGGLYAALDQLLPRQRNLVQKVFFEGQSVSEIARREGVGESAIRDRLNNIYKKLKKILK